MSLALRLAAGAAATIDRTLVAAAGLRRGRAESLGHEDRLAALRGIRDAYGHPDLWRDPDAYFTPPGPIEPQLRRVRDQPGGGAVVDASWPSRFVPYLPEMRDRYLAHERNRTAHARLYLGARPRPAVVLLHGYLAGQWRVEELVWPVAWLDRQGLDVAVALLPFHALRRRPLGPPPFPGADPRMTNEGFRQAMHDLRALVRWLRSRGAPGVGVMGMSLGGYTTALLMTVEPGLAFGVPVIPLASVADFARDHGRLGRADHAAEQHRLLEEANRVVSPLSRPSLLASERVLVIGGEADRITPIRHAERLAAHFGAPLCRYPGGHLMQVGIRQGYRELGHLLRRTVGGGSAG